MPGQTDVWNPVTSFFRTALQRVRPSQPLTADDTVCRGPASDAAPIPETAARPGRRRAMRIGGLATAFVLVAAGSAAGVARAHKTVTLDVDGVETQVSTFSGSVAGVLEAQDVELGQRDVVAPAVTEPLRDGDEVVVRSARQVVVQADGEESHVWTTALSADEVLASLATRGDDVRLVASRSAADGRAALPVVLDLDGPVEVKVDGRTETVADGSVGLDRVLADLDVTVGELDRVSVLPADGADGAVTVLVQRVAAEEQPTVSEVPFEQVTEQTDDLYVGQTRVAQEGVVGERTVVHRVILVDGVEESRVELSDTVTRAPVTEVVREGTKERPAPRPAPAPARAPAASGGGGGGGAVPTGDVWAALAQCESGGNPTAVSSSGTYHGLYQFSVATWQSVGGAGLPSQASPEEQTMRAQMLQARSGWGQWPHCSSKLGLR